MDANACSRTDYRYTIYSLLLTIKMYLPAMAITSWPLKFIKFIQLKSQTSSD